MSNIDGLAADWLIAKADENAANKRRIKIEEQMIEALETKPEGSITHTLQSHKVTLTQPITRKIDEKAWAMVKHKLPVDMHPIKIKIEADAAGMKYLANNEPSLWAGVASAFETKAGKVGVKVEEI
jgi:hypothetical protein